MPLGSQNPYAAVVGARGFLGRALLRELGRRELPVLPVTREDLAGELVWRDLTRATTVFWAAATINPAIAAEEPGRVEDDRRSIHDFLDRLRASGSAARLVYFSSGGTVYGGGTPPFSETSPAMASSAYGLAKLQMEKDVHDCWADTVVVRISNAYGPFQQPAPGQGVIGHWLRAAARRDPIRVFGDLQTVRDYLFVDDLVDALIRIHLAPASPAPVLNLGSGEPTTLQDVLEVVCSVTESHAPEVQVEASRSFDLDATWLDVGLARQTLDWRPTTDLTTGIRAMWKWIHDHEMAQRGSHS